MKEETEGAKKGSPFGGNGVRIDEKQGNPNNRKASQNIPLPEEEEYDPRKHRIHRGVRKTSVEWTGGYVKLGNAVGTKK